MGGLDGVLMGFSGGFLWSLWLFSVSLELLFSAVSAAAGWVAEVVWLKKNENGVWGFGVYLDWEKTAEQGWFNGWFLVVVLEEDRWC